MQNEGVDSALPTARALAKTDIVIAGAGATGLALGLAISRLTNFHVTFVETGEQISTAKNRSESSDFLDLRSVALSAQSCQFLKEIGLTSIQQQGCEIAQIHVSDKGHLAHSTMAASDYQLPELGRVIELPLLVSNLYQTLASGNKQVEWCWQSEILNIERTSESVTVNLSSGVGLKAKLLVVAEGGTSSTRDKLGIDVKHHNYRQSAIVANVELAQSHQNWAYERFTSNGPLALLPLPGSDSLGNRHRSSLVWTMTNEQVQSLMAKDKSDFLRQLQHEFGYRLGEFTDIGERAWFPLTLTQARQHVHHRSALVGNACQTLHPIAGQGLNLALRDVKALFSLLCSSQDIDPGTFQLLNVYQQARQKDQHLLIQATEALVSAFSNDYFPLVIGRNVALSALDNSPRIKRALAMRAMGFQYEDGR